MRELRETVRKMLKENGAPPANGKWADIAVLEPVRDYKARHASTMLTFDAVVDAIGQIEAKRGEKTAAQSRGRVQFDGRSTHPAATPASLRPGPAESLSATPCRR